MRTAFFAFAVSLLLSIPTIASTNLLVMEDNFPESWEKTDDLSCTTENGAKIKTEKYVRLNVDTDRIEIIYLIYKNKVLYVQVKTTAGKVGGGAPSDLKIVTKDNRVFSSHFTKESAQKADSMIFETLGITKEENDSCVLEE